MPAWPIRTRENWCLEQDFQRSYMCLYTYRGGYSLCVWVFLRLALLPSGPFSVVSSLAADQINVIRVSCEVRPNLICAASTYYPATWVISVPVAGELG
jgi:hypothetical protein